MSKRAVYINLILFVISIVLLGLMIYQQINGGFLMISETLSIALLSFSFVLKKHNYVKGQWLCFGLLIVLLVQIIDFSYTVQNENGFITYHTSKFTSPSINPVVFIILIAFLIVNWRIFGLLLYGSVQERKDEFDKKVLFYYNKFNLSGNEELEGIFNLYKEYPKEAQVALRKINEERELNFI